jgi:ribosomal protein L11 methylase PrmA
MYLRLTPQMAICSPWHPCWPRPGEKLWRISYSRTFPINHPSTRLCLDLLILACQEKSVASLLDIGCGSGILTLAGAMLGVAFSVGCDILPAAIRTSQENARRLHLTGQVAWVQGSTEALGSPFDLVVANLPFQIQLAKSEELVRLSNQKGGIILSGFKDTQEREITQRYLSCGWRLRRRITKDLWEMELPADKSFTWTGLYFMIEEKSYLLQNSACSEIPAQLNSATPMPAAPLTAPQE